MSSSFKVQGQLIDLHKRRIYPATVDVFEGVIKSIVEEAEAPAQYILPGFIDAHVHIESSMLTPAHFARMAVVHGTVATISDPHEIANVCGKEGVQWMIDNAKTVPFKCFFGAPSCVPATSFETAGASLDSTTVKELLSSPNIWYLAEMMNYPGVLNGDTEVLAKIDAARNIDKPVDGHAPGLRGEAVVAYASAGISTDHECTTQDEALEKVAVGMKILIREGSAAKNFDALHPLLEGHAALVMFCSDDKHPDDLAVSHINGLVTRAIDKGYDMFDVLRAACVNPVVHYGVPVGLLREGDPADFIVVNDLQHWVPAQTYIGAVLVAEEGHCLFDVAPATTINRFRAKSRRSSEYVVHTEKDLVEVSVIEAHEGQLVTSSRISTLRSEAGALCADVEADVLKLVVLNRYEELAEPAVAFISGFGFKRGAIASTVAHDCHNIIAVGVDDECISAAINALIAQQGGIAVASAPDKVEVLPLPIAGLMTDQDGYVVGEQYARLTAAAKDLGSKLTAPFMTLSFMALLVIPALKLSDKGLFDGTAFRFTSLEA
jgi:adenine deaminase